MTETEYRQHPAISRSDLWYIHESPEKFRWHMDHPEPPTAALLFGQVVHKLVLQPDDFDSEFAVMPDVDGRTVEGKAARAAFFTDSVGKTVIDANTYSTAKDMAAVLHKAPFVDRLLRGDREKPYFWTDELTGEQCKCRVDCITQVGEKLIVVDYKTAADASGDAFMRDAVRYGYTLQAGMYLEGTQADSFVFIVQEKKPPYSVNILEADAAFIQKGRDLFRELIGIYHHCKETGEWYGYLGAYNMINSLSLPVWMKEE